MQDLQFSRRFIKLINLKLQKRSAYIKDLHFSCQVPATYVKEIYKANSNQTQKLQKLQHYQRNLTNMNAATHIYQRIKPQHLSNFINHSPKREIEWVFGLRLSVCLGWRLLCFSFCVFFFFSHVFSPLAATVYVLYMNSSRNFWPVFVNGTSVHCLRTYKFHFLSIFSLKMGPTTPFTYLKIILLQWFQ